MKKNILLVDDDYIFCYVNRIMIEKSKKAETIATASNGKEALEILTKSAATNVPLPELILLDINMPIMNGFEFLNAFNTMELPHKEKISIVIVSSSENPEDVERAKSLGVDKYLSKPLTEAAIKGLLD